MFIEEANAYFLPLRSGWGSSLKWDFYTEVQTIFDGSEDRISLRPIPWEKISYRYTFPDSDSKKIKPFLSGHLRADYIVPLYYLGVDVDRQLESFIIDDVLVSKIQLKVINTGSKALGYEAMGYGSYIALYKGFDVVLKKVFPRDGHQNEEGNVIVFYYSDGFDFSGWKVCPARFGKITNNPSIETNKKYSIVDIEYEMYDTVEFYEEEDQEKYKGFDVYKKCLLLAGDTLPITNTKDLDISQNDLGIKKYFSDWIASYRSFDLRKVLADRFEFTSFLRWCMRRLGRYEPFWCPTYSTDFGLISVTNNSISVESGDEKLDTFAIYRDDGSFYLVTADSIAKDGDLITYSFAIDFENIPEKVYYAILMRLSDDSISFDFSLGGNIVTSSVAVRSVF